MALLEVKNLFKSFSIEGSKKIVQAVNGVSFSLERGETLGLVGESGSGKTTIGRCVVGLLEKSSGEIIFDNKPVTRRRNIRSKSLQGRIQLVFQEPSESLNPRMRISRSIEEPLINLGMNRSERKKKVLEVVEKVNLDKNVITKYPIDLSAGHQQRVGIARAIITDPELIVLDEPTSALDPTARAEIIDLLMNLQNITGVSYIFVSHDLGTVRYLTDKTVVLYLGEIVEEGRTNDLFNRPFHPYSIGLLSSILMPDPNSNLSLSDVNLEGEIPSPIDLPTGCYMASRCRFKKDDCEITRPKMKKYAGRMVRCHRSEHVLQTNAIKKMFDTFETNNKKLFSRIGTTITAKNVQS